MMIFITLVAMRFLILIPQLLFEGDQQYRLVMTTINYDDLGKFDYCCQRKTLEAQILITILLRGVGQKKRLSLWWKI